MENTKKAPNECGINTEKVIKEWNSNCYIMIKREGNVLATCDGCFIINESQLKRIASKLKLKSYYQGNNTFLVKNI